MALLTFSTLLRIIFRFLPPEGSGCGSRCFGAGLGIGFAAALEVFFASFSCLEGLFANFADRPIVASVLGDHFVRNR